MNQYRSCSLCPRNCNIDRTHGQKGFCDQSDEMVISTVALHFGEEPPITGEGGSGTVFFSGCTMQCPFCQNWQISRGFSGSVVTVDELSKMMIELQRRGAENINFVTGTHFLPSIKMAVQAAKEDGLSIPLIWNCSGYETEDSVDELNTFIDIYLPDYKVSESSLAARFYGAGNYPLLAGKAILKMVESRSLEFTQNRKMKRGVFIRHLVLPGELGSSRKFFKWYSDNLKNKAMISVMVQYTPVHIPGNKIKIPQRFISQQEYDSLLDSMDEYGIDEGFFQDLETGSDWLPDFSNVMAFPSKQTKVIWSSVKKGYINKEDSLEHEGF